MFLVASSVDFLICILVAIPPKTCYNTSKSVQQRGMERKWNTNWSPWTAPIWRGWRSWSGFASPRPGTRPCWKRRNAYPMSGKMNRSWNSYGNTTGAGPSHTTPTILRTVLQYTIKLYCKKNLNQQYTTIQRRSFCPIGRWRIHFLSEARKMRLSRNMGSLSVRTKAFQKMEVPISYD